VLASWCSYITSIAVRNADVAQLRGVLTPYVIFRGPGGADASENITVGSAARGRPNRCPLCHVGGEEGSTNTEARGTGG
jgi:hypothetical protein